MKTLKQVQMDHILNVLKWAGYSRTKASGILGVSVRTLGKYIKEYITSGYYVPTSFEYKDYGVDAQPLKDMSEKDLEHINTKKEDVKKAPVEIEFTYDYFPTNEERLHYRNTGRRLNSGESA